MDEVSLQLPKDLKFKQKNRVLIAVRQYQKLTDNGRSIKWQMFFFFEKETEGPTNQQNSQPEFGRRTNPRTKERTNERTNDSTK